MSNWSELKQALPLKQSSSEKAETYHSPLQLCSLDHKCAIAVQGPDSKKFLQGQLTCNLDDVKPNQWRLGAHCNHKGRMISSFRASALSEEHILLTLRHSISDSALAALAKYAIFSKVELSISDGLIGLGLAGEQAELQLSAWELTIDEGNSVYKDGVQVLDIGGGRFELWAELEKIKNLLEQLKSDATLVDNSHWKLLDIQAGIAEIEAGVEEAIIPQMLNFNELDGINYQKGCYTGQEIIARMQYRGNVKRHTVRLIEKKGDKTAETQVELANLESGMSVYSADQKAVGELVNFAKGPQGLEALAVVKDGDEQAELALSEDGPWNFTIEPLPYAIT